MPKLVGINHIALEVGDLDEALAFWESIFGPLEMRGRGGGMAFIDLGDQFIALSHGRSQPPDEARHFGLVVDDKEAVRARLQELGVKTFGRGLDFLDDNLHVGTFRATLQPGKSLTVVLSAEASYHAPYDHCTVKFLEQAGVHSTWIKLGEAGIHGNGHMLMLEKNNIDIAEIMLRWLSKAGL